MVRTLRIFTVVLLLVSAVTPVFARGGNEEAPDAEVPVEAAEPSPPDPAGEDALPTALERSTAELLFGLGVLPFENRIPSQDFTLLALGGGESSLSQYKGQVVFLNFWATWCGPCRDEMPSMQTLYDTLADDGLEIVAVNVLEPEDLVSEFVDEFGFTYPVLMDRNGRVSLQYSVQAYPTTYILDRDGFVIGMRRGTLDWATPQMIEGFRELLAL